jgi:type I restriction enzyme S subunit
MSNIEGWQLKILGAVADITMGQSPDSSDCSDTEIGLPFLQGCAEFSTKYPAVKQYCSRPKKIAAKGAVLFSVRAPVGKTNSADQEYAIGRGLAAFKATLISQDYLEYYLAFSERDFSLASQGSTFEAINSKELTNWSINFPVDEQEQTQIITILSTIDKAIEQTEAIIAKQQRIKTGLMQDLLTRGIDEAGNIRSEATHEFKDSPLGRIPVEWEVMPAFQICNAVIDCKNRTPPVKKEGHPVVRTPNVRNGRFVYEELVFTDHASYKTWTERGKPKAGDVLITREAPFGEACMIPPEISDACLGQRMMMYQPDTLKIRNDFLVHIIYSEIVQRKLMELAGGSTVGHIRVGDIRSLPIPHPQSLDEQIRIVEALNGAKRIIDQLNRNSKKLKLTKAGLMQDLLTGKVRVTDLLTSSNN